MIDGFYEMACIMRFARSQHILISIYFVPFIFFSINETESAFLKR